MTVEWIALWVISPILGLAMLLALFRLLVGPSIPDRVVALDLLAAIGIGAIAVASVASGEGAFLDVAIVVGLVGFLATVAFARYLERQS